MLEFKDKDTGKVIMVLEDDGTLVLENDVKVEKTEQGSGKD